MPTFVSLGHDCEVAHQIRRITGAGRAYLFDWLITPFEACSVLTGDDAAWFRPGNWEVAADGVRVRDKGTRLEFQHEFDVEDEATQIIDVAKVEAHLETARNKYLYLKYRTQRLLRTSDDLCLLRKEPSADAEQAGTVAAAIVEALSGLSANLKVVVVSEDADLESASDRHLFLKIKASEAWTGDDPSWDRVLTRAAAWCAGETGF